MNEADDRWEAEFAEYLESESRTADLDLALASMPGSNGHEWYEFLSEVLGWDLRACEAYSGVYRDPFAMAEVVGQTFPLFASPTPLLPDMEDEIADHICKWIERDHGDALVLWNGPATRKLSGREFSYFGRLRWENHWHEVLLNENMRSLEDVIKAVGGGLDIDSPPAELEDKDHRVAVAAYVTLFRKYGACPEWVSVAHFEESSWKLFMDAQTFRELDLAELEEVPRQLH